MKRVFILVLGLCMVGSFLGAEDPKPIPDLTKYLDQLQVKLAHTAQRANQPTNAGSSVVGLRGSKQEPLSKQLYWKGRNGTKTVTTDEVKLFRSAVEDARAGNKDSAVAGLKAFIEKYPKSALRPDAENALALMTPAAPPAAAQTTK